MSSIHKSKPIASRVNNYAMSHNLTRWVLAMYILILIYVSEHPLESVRLSDANPFGFLNVLRLNWVGMKPYGVGTFDSLSNFLAYVPLGFLLFRVLLQRLKAAQAMVSTSVLATVLSLCLEAFQTYNPMRVPSVWDVGVNALGALAGVLLCMLWLRTFKLNNPSRRQPLLWMLAPHAGAIWAILGLWCLAQLHPQSWVFVTAPISAIGNLGFNYWGVLEIPVTFLPTVETVMASLAMFSFLGLVRVGSRFKDRPLYARILWMLFAWGLMLLWQVCVYLLEFGVIAPLAQWGENVWLACKLALVWALVCSVLSLPLTAAITVCLLCLYTILLQIVPAHPFVTTSNMLMQAKFTHLYGLTEVFSVCWPIGALAALSLQLRYVKKTPKTKRS